MNPPYVISAKSLPLESPIVFQNSSYFTNNGSDAKLPTPSVILAQSAVQSPSFEGCKERPPVFFRESGLVVKLGKDPKVSIAEGQCLWALRQVPNIRVPEIYGWAQDADFTYLYMELVDGSTLENLWESLERHDRVLICEQLRSMISELRCLQQEPDDAFLGRQIDPSGNLSLTSPGHINRGPFADIVFTKGVQPRAGPFSTVVEFHDWLSSRLTWGSRQHWPDVDPADIPDPYRQGLPDTSSIVFTHADLHPSNILISLEKPHRIVAIVDWQQSGWYPDYWEFRKAEYTAEPRSEWVTEYIPRFLEEPGCIDTFELYARAFGF